jgi:hypothetical protein
MVINLAFTGYIRTLTTVYGHITQTHWKQGASSSKRRDAVPFEHYVKIQPVTDIRPQTQEKCGVHDTATTAAPGFGDALQAYNASDRRRLNIS